MNKKYIPYLIVIILMIAGFMIRAKGTLLGYFAFTFDPARDMLAIHDLVYNHKISLIGPTTGLPGVFYGPWWYWILTPVFFISGGDPKALILWVSFLSILMIPIGYYLGNKIGGALPGLFLASVFAFSHVFISSSVQLWNPNLVPFFTLLTFFLLYKIIVEKKKYFFLLGLAIGSVFEFQMAFGMFFTLGLVVSFVLLKIKKYILWTFFDFGKIMAAFLVLLSPRILFDVRHDLLMSKSYIANLMHPKVFQLPLTLAERFIDRGEIFFRPFVKTLSNENTFTGLVLFVSIIFMLISVFAAKEKKSIKIFLFVIINIVAVVYLSFSFYPDALWEYYIIGLPVLYVLSFAVGLSIFRNKKWIQLGLVISLILISSNIKGLLNSSTGDWEGDASVFINQKRVVDAIYEKQKGKPFDVIVYTPALIDYHYQYLFTWLGKNKHKYMPVKNNRTVYYIVEHKEGEDAERDWLIGHKDDGLVLSKELMPGSIYIEERIREDK